MLDQTITLQRHQLLDRVATGTPHAADIRENVGRAFDIATQLDAERDRIGRDENLSDVGRRSALAEVVKTELAPALASGAARRARRADQFNASQRAAIGQPQFAKDDMVAAHDRAEVRSYLRSLPDGQRFQAATEMMGDEKLAQAVLSGPSIRLSGLTREQADRLHTLYLQRHHADQVGEVDALQQDIDVLQTSVAFARQRLVGASGMGEREFGEFWQTLEDVADR